MDLTKVLSLLFGAIGLLGGVAVFFGGARKDSIIAVLTKENITLKDYTSTLENSTARLTAERDGYQRQYEDVKELAQGSPQLKVLTSEFRRLNAVNGQILQTLENSSVTLAKDTKRIRKAAQQVKSDLEESR